MGIFLFSDTLPHSQANASPILLERGDKVLSIGKIYCNHFEENSNLYLIKNLFNKSAHEKLLNFTVNKNTLIYIIHTPFEEL